jgi:ABC-type nitrate/sulfonate/bicarbonate transport system substrate-binding protein
MRSDAAHARRLACLLTAVLALTPALGACRRAAAPTPPRPLVRVGWQTTWATQGQLAVILQRTNALELSGLDGRFVGFSYGGPLNEGALAGEVDVVFTADQPALTLAARAPEWRIIGRLMYNRVGTLVPPESPVVAPADLRGRTLAVPFGAAAQREAMAALEQAGLDPARDVRLVNLGIQELVALAKAGARGGRWGEIDALAAWDPPFAELQARGLGRPLAQAVVTSVALMNTRFRDAHPGADRRLVRALRLAYDFYRREPARADAWFRDASGIDFGPGVLTLAASVEPNVHAAGAAAITVTLGDHDLAALQRAADFMAAHRLLREPVKVATLVEPPAAEDGAPPFGEVREAVGPTPDEH